MYFTQNGNDAGRRKEAKTMYLTMHRTDAFNALADGILNATAENLGYSREDLDRVVGEMRMEDELPRMILDAICREVSRKQSAWRGLALRTANEIASQVSSREFETGLKINMQPEKE